MDSSEFIDDDHGCGTLLQGNARYCTQCGCMSTFYAQGILKDWHDEYDPQHLPF